MTEKLENKIENFNNALNRLGEMCVKFRNSKDKEEKETCRDALIQRFEFTFELGWKTLYQYMIFHGVSVRSMPRDVLKAAYQNGLIDNEQVWLDMLDARNTLSHVYKEEQAIAIAEKICPDFYNELATLKDLFKE